MESKLKKYGNTGLKMYVEIVTPYYAFIKTNSKLYYLPFGIIAFSMRQ